MATVQLADIYNPKTFGRRTQEAAIQLNRFIGAGIVAADSAMQSQIAQGGNIGELTEFKPITYDEPNYSNDDPDDKSTPDKVISALQRFRGASRNKSWSTMDLARELALADPVGAITGSIGKYWATDNEKRIIYSCRGILADNIANDGGDMRISIATDAVGAPADAEKIGGSVVIDALQTLGDHSFAITAMAMHSVPFSTLQKQGLIEYVRDATNTIDIPTYLGKRVIVDDSLPAIAGVNRITYTTILFGGAIFGSASGKVLVPSEMKRDPDAGNGGGQDTIFSRAHDFFHPLGFDFTSAAVAGKSATYAELATAGNWDRKVNRKNIPLAFLQTNG